MKKPFYNFINREHSMVFGIFDTREENQFAPFRVRGKQIDFPVLEMDYLSSFLNSLKSIQ